MDFKDLKEFQIGSKDIKLNDSERNVDLTLMRSFKERKVAILPIGEEEDFEFRAKKKIKIKMKKVK